MSSEIASRLRALAGVYAKDWLRYRRRMAAPDDSYLSICNRYETLESNPGGPGQRCMWQWTSTLHAPTVVPDLGLRLMRRALSDHPVRRASTPRNAGGAVDLSFVIGHRGGARLPLLLATLESIAAQRDVSLECIVVEQDAAPSVESSLPSWVRHIHIPCEPGLPFSRSWAFNVGAREARASVLVLHDNDMVISEDYASCVLRHVNDGYDVVNLKRFIFYLAEQHTGRYLSAAPALAQSPPAFVVQNAEGGGSVGITRGGYERIGGMDESFVGWGGEDNEFWERALTLRVWPYGYLPLVHLWHPAQAGKQSADNPMLRLYRSLSSIPVADRISRLRQTPAGLMAGPAERGAP